MNKCESCGQKIRKLNPHRMDKKKVDVLKAIFRLNQYGHEWAAPKHGHEIHALHDDGSERLFCVGPYRSSEHAYRLFWFGLLDYAGHRTGHFKINDNGIKFLSGDLYVPKTIWCRDGVVVERSEEQVGIHQVKGIILDKAYWDNYGAEQKIYLSTFSSLQ